MAGRKTLILVEPENRLVHRASRNLPRVETLPADSVNVVDILSHEWVLASQAAIETMTKTFKRA